MSSKNILTFSAELYRIGQLRAADLPDDVAEALGGEHKVPLLITLDGRQRATSLIRGKKGFRVYVHSGLFKPAGVDAGDEVVLTVQIDPCGGRTEVPDDLRRALIESPGALEGFDRSTPSKRRELVRLVEQAKSEATRKKYIRRVVQIMRES